MASDLHFRTIADLSAQLAAKELSAVDLMRAVIARTRAVVLPTNRVSKILSTGVSTE